MQVKNMNSIIDTYTLTQDVNNNNCISINGKPIIYTLDEAAKKLNALQEQINMLQNEIMEDKITILCEYEPVPIEEGSEEKWYDSGCSSDKLEAGEWLVKNKGWIKSDIGVGRRQFYKKP